jgi:S-formylglutathione hydrolase FrmB
MAPRRLAALAAVPAAALALALAVSAHGSAANAARVVNFTIDSRLVHQVMPVAAVIPAGTTSRPRPLLVFLHGFGGNQDSSLVATMFAALARLGTRAPDVVFPYGGPDSYWHDRSSGAWGSYVISEVIPQAIARLHADPTRIAIGGISMGGFGALDIARLHPGRFCAVGGHSPALFLSGGQSAAGAFDSAEDFARHDVVAAARARDPYRGTAVWIDAGTQDPFLAADRVFVAALRADGHSVQFHVWPGAHDQSYWDSHYASYLPFYADALTRCHAA